MNQTKRISESEKQIMDLIWSSSKPITTKEIMEQLPKGMWKQNTVITFLSRLIEKGLVTSTRVSKANYYEAVISEQNYKKSETRQFVKDVHKGSFLGLVSALCDSGELTKEELETLLERIKD